MTNRGITLLSLTLLSFMWTMAVHPVFILQEWHQCKRWQHKWRQCREREGLPSFTLPLFTLQEWNQCKWWQHIQQQCRERKGLTSFTLMLSMLLLTILVFFKPSFTSFSMLPFFSATFFTTWNDTNNNTVRCFSVQTVWVKLSCNIYSQRWCCIGMPSLQRSLH